MLAILRGGGRSSRLVALADAAVGRLGPAVRLARPSTDAFDWVISTRAEHSTELFSCPCPCRRSANNPAQAAGLTGLSRRGVSVRASAVAAPSAA